MKKLYYTFILFFCICSQVIAQQATPPAAQAVAPSIAGLKIAFVTKQLLLTNEESQKYWPAYYDYQDDMKKARQEESTDILANEERVLNIRKRYRVELKKILGSDECVNRALTIDREFNNVVKRELLDRAEQRRKNGSN